MTMLAPLTLFDTFGKLDRGTRDRWHPLSDHMADVAAVFEALCDCTSIRRALESASGRTLVSGDVSRLSALVFLHDLGKANAGFQAKRWSDDERPRGWLTCGHGAEAVALVDAAASGIEEAWKLLSRLPVEAMAGWGEDAAMQRFAPEAFIESGQPLSDAPRLEHLSEVCARKSDGSSRITLSWQGSPYCLNCSASRYGYLHAV